MNARQRSFCDGAAMAYNDTAKMIRSLIKDAPANLKTILSSLEPMAVACEAKAKTVHTEAQNYTKGTRQ